MKKIYLLLIVALLFFAFIGCTVNSTTGRITVANTTNATMTNVKVGDTLIVSSLGPGKSYDYYFFKTLTGQITVEGLDDLNVRGQDPDEDLEYTGYGGCKRAHLYREIL